MTSNSQPNSSPDSNPRPIPLRVGIVGFGMIGKVHAFAYRTLPFYAPRLPVQARITHVATSRSETAERAKNLIDCDVATTDFREITENPAIDVVHICSPNARHFPVLLSAVQNNKAIYCEKPLTVSLDEARTIEAELAKTDAQGRRLFSRTTQTTFHLRFFSAMRRAKQLLDEKRLGRIFQYRIGYFHASNASEATPFKWKHSESGGVVRDLASHLLDLVDYLIGLPNELIADSVVAFPTRPIPTTPEQRLHNASYRRTVEAEDAVSILTRGLLSSPDSDRPFSPDSDESAIQGVIEATKLATGCEDEMKLEIFGEKGSLRFSLMNPHYLEFFDATKSDRPFGGDSGWLHIPCGGRYEYPDSDFPSPKSTTGWVRAHVASLARFLDDVAAGRPGNPSLEQGIRIQAALETVFQSCRARAWTPLQNRTNEALS